MSLENPSSQQSGAQVLIPVTMVISLGFVAIGIPLQFSREWIALGWITVGCVLWYYSCRTSDKTLTVMSLLFTGFALLRFLAIDFLALLQYRKLEIEGYAPDLRNTMWPSLLFACVLILTGVITRIMQRKTNTKKEWLAGGPVIESERISGTRTFGVFGLWIFLIFTSFELFHYYESRTWLHHWRLFFIAALSLYWTLFATLIHVIGLKCRSYTIRYNANMLYLFIAIKTMALDIWQKPRDVESFRSLSERLAETTAWEWFRELLRPEDWNVVWNYYAFPLLLVATLMILAGVFALRGGKYHGCVLDTSSERVPYMAIGLFGFSLVLLVLSIECYSFFHLREKTIPEGLYLAHCSLTYLWTTFGLIVFVLGIQTRSFSLRSAGLIVFLLIAMKSLGLDFYSRPESYTRPLLNPFALSVLYLVTAMLFAAIATNRLAKRGTPETADKLTDRDAATAIGVFGLTLLWFVLSLELYLYITLEANEFPHRDYLGVALLSVLWTVFGTGLYVTGIASKSFVLRGCGMLVLFAAALKTCLYDMPYRPEAYVMPLWNLFAMPCLTLVAAMLLVAYQSTRNISVTPHEERQGARVLGGIGIGILWVLLSMELYLYFDVRKTVYPEAEFLAIASLSVLWTIIASVTFFIGVLKKSLPLRLCAAVIFLVTAGKILVLDFTRRPESYATPLLNAFGLPTLLTVCGLMFLGVFSCRIVAEKKTETKNFFLGVGMIGLAMLWGLLSVELANYFLLQKSWLPSMRMYYSNLSVTLLWLTFAGALLALASLARSKALRYLGMCLSVLIMLKAAGRDLFGRPDFYNEFWRGDFAPFFNSYMLPLLLVCVYLIALGVAGQQRIAKRLRKLHEEEAAAEPAAKARKKRTLEMFDVEMQLYRILAYAGLAILLVSTSIECFYSYDIRHFPDKIQHAQMALSILWAVFGGTLLFIGFRGHSAVLRWCSILLLSVTTIKVFLVDLSGVDSLYKVGAFLMLAVILGLGARAYQRFHPENFGGKK